MEIDPKLIRNRRDWSYQEYFFRQIWSCVYVIFRLTPSWCPTIRNLLLRCFGARLGRDVRIAPTAAIFAPWRMEIGDFVGIGPNVQIYNLSTVRIGSRSTISMNSLICGGDRDLESPSLELKKEPVEIGADCWIGADVFIGPGVRLSDGVRVGARTSIFKSIEVAGIYCGAPVKKIK